MPDWTPYEPETFTIRKPFGVTHCVDVYSLYPHIVTELRKQFEELAGKYKDFPYHVVITRPSEQQRDYLQIVWSLDPRGREVVSELGGKIKGPWEGKFLIEVNAIRHKESYPGEENPERYWERNYRHGAGWRQERFVTELSARALWPLLECHANSEKVVQTVLSR